MYFLITGKVQFTLLKTHRLLRNNRTFSFTDLKRHINVKQTQFYVAWKGLNFALFYVAVFAYVEASAENLVSSFT